MAAEVIGLPDGSMLLAAGMEPGPQLAEALAVNSMLTFAHEVTPTPQLAKLIRAAYDPVMPSIARDPSHALRLAARLPH